MTTPLPPFHALALLACLLPLASCNLVNTGPSLEGKWASQTETDYLYAKDSVLIRSFPTSVVGKYRIQITTDSFIHFGTQSARSQRLGAHSYLRQGTTIVVPETGQQFTVKTLTPDTLLLVYKRPSPAGTLDEHVNSGFTLTRLPTSDETAAVTAPRNHSPTEGPVAARQR